MADSSGTFVAQHFQSLLQQHQTADDESNKNINRMTRPLLLQQQQ